MPQIIPIKDLKNTSEISDMCHKAEEPIYEARAINENFADPEIKFGIPITYFANDTAYMKQAEIEGSLKVGTQTFQPPRRQKRAR